MSRICEVCGKKPVAGRTYARRGLAKSKGGVGRKITGVTKRRFRPNIQVVRIVDEKGTVRRSRICVKCLRTGLRKGTIKKAVRKPRRPKEVPEPTSATPAVLEEHVERRPGDEGGFDRTAAEPGVQSGTGGAGRQERSGPPGKLPGTESEARAEAPGSAEATEVIETAEPTETTEGGSRRMPEGLGDDGLDNLGRRGDRDIPDGEPQDE